VISLAVVMAAAAIFLGQAAKLSTQKRKNRKVFHLNFAAMQQRIVPAQSEWLSS